MEVQAHILASLIDGDSGGNLAAVVLGADHLNPEQRLKIARAVGLSETAFVSASDTCEFKLDFFTPNRQIAHCGHATIAAFSLLKQQSRLTGDRSSKETIDGKRNIFLDGDRVYMEQRRPGYEEIGDEAETVLQSIGLTTSHLAAEPFVVDTGNSFMIIPLADAQTVRGAVPNFDQIADISEKYDLIGYYIFSQETELPGRDAGTRMFAPRYAIPEEAATGMAAGPLACYLHDQLHLKKAELTIEQGYLMAPPSPSVVSVKLVIENGAIQSLVAGGRAKLVEVRTITI